ncbi:hypothetical protein V6N12_056609 [Hibiscus sabdariffa]|uniref:Uncharacterized protein n=1 Tax=Hibiscus sabdariffa TaxID=183260 RepID=A0ABR2CT10_9ROSI
MIDKIAATLPPRPQYGTDLPGWRWEERRHFTLGSTYDFFNEWRGADTFLLIQSVEFVNLDSVYFGGN